MIAVTALLTLAKFAEGMHFYELYQPETYTYVSDMIGRDADYSCAYSVSGVTFPARQVCLTPHGLYFAKIGSDNFIGTLHHTATLGCLHDFDLSDP